MARLIWPFSARKPREGDDGAAAHLADEAPHLGGLGIGEGLDQPPAAHHDHETDDEIGHAAALHFICFSSSAAAPPRSAEWLDERLVAARRIDGDRGQQFAQHLGGILPEAEIGAARQPRDLAEARFGLGIAPLLEHEDGNADKPDLARDRGQLVDRLFHGVADIDAGIDLARPASLRRCFSTRMIWVRPPMQRMPDISRASDCVSGLHFEARHSPWPRK